MRGAIYTAANYTASWAAIFGPATAVVHQLHSTYVRFSVLALSSIFFLVDPFAAIPSFIAITSGADAKRRRRMAAKASLTCFIVLAAFSIAGRLIFRMFGITLPAFEIAGGLILLLIGIDMLEANRSPTQEASEEAQEGAAKEDAGIVPLGIPMLAGPGAISSVMVLVGSAPTKWQMFAIIAAIAITALASYGVLNGADRLRRLLGETGIRILVRIMGLLLMALAVQFFVNGLTDLGVISKQESFCLRLAGKNRARPRSQTNSRRERLLHKCERLASGGGECGDGSRIGFCLGIPVEGEAEIDPAVVKEHAAGCADGVEAGDIDTA